MGLTGLACEVNDLSRQQQEPPLIGNPRFLKRGGCQGELNYEELREGIEKKNISLLIIFRGVKTSTELKEKWRWLHMVYKVDLFDVIDDSNANGLSYIHGVLPTLIFATERNFCGGYARIQFG